MRILITGHRGFIGRHFWDYLCAAGHMLHGVDIKPDPEDYGGSGMDCRDLFKHDDTVYDLVIHCAAIVGGRAKIENEPLAVATDLSIDAELFNWAVRTHQPRVVYFSSSAAYPNTFQQRVCHYHLKESDINIDDEHEPIYMPDFTYGWAKLTGEMLAAYAERQGVKVHVFRPFSGYGEDQDLDYPFPSLIKRVAERQDPFVIWGDGEQVRDFIHVDDIVAAVMRCVELDHRAPLNLGWGIPISFNKLATMMFHEAGWVPRTITHLTDKPTGVQYRCCDPTAMHKIYKPRITLEAGIQRCLGWFSLAGGPR